MIGVLIGIVIATGVMEAIYLGFWVMEQPDYHWIWFVGLYECIAEWSQERELHREARAKAGTIRIVRRGDKYFAERLTGALSYLGEFETERLGHEFVIGCDPVEQWTKHGAPILFDTIEECQRAADLVDSDQVIGEYRKGAR